MNTEVKTIIEKNIETIENEDFDTLFKSINDYGTRLLLADALLSAGVDITNHNPSINLKQQNVKQLVNDLRFDRSLITFKKASRPIYEYHGLPSDDKDYYILGLPKNQKISRDVNIPNIKEIYGVQHIAHRVFLTGYMSGYIRYCLAFPVS